MLFPSQVMVEGYVQIHDLDVIESVPVEVQGLLLILLSLLRCSSLLRSWHYITRLCKKMVVLSWASGCTLVQVKFASFALHGVLINVAHWVVLISSFCELKLFVITFMAFIAIIFLK